MYNVLFKTCHQIRLAYFKISLLLLKLILFLWVLWARIRAEQNFPLSAAGTHTCRKGKVDFSRFLRMQVRFSQASMTSFCSLNDKDSKDVKILGCCYSRFRNIAVERNGRLF